MRILIAILLGLLSASPASALLVPPDMHVGPLYTFEQTAYPGAKLSIYIPDDIDSPHFVFTDYEDLSFSGYFTTPGFTIWQGSVCNSDGELCFPIDTFGGASTILIYVAPAVPEPSTWAMLLIGFIFISFAASR